MMYLSEAMARLRGARYTISDQFPLCRIDVLVNQFGDHAPEGVEYLMLQLLGEVLNIGLETIKRTKLQKETLRDIACASDSCL